MKMIRSEASLPIEAMPPKTRKARTHSQKLIRKVPENREAKDFGTLIAPDADYRLIARRGRLSAMKASAKSDVPVTVPGSFTRMVKRTLRRADICTTQHASRARTLIAINFVVVKCWHSGYIPTEFTKRVAECHAPASQVCRRHLGWHWSPVASEYSQGSTSRSHNTPESNARCRLLTHAHS